MSAAVTLYTRKGQPFVVDGADADAVVAAGPWCYFARKNVTYLQRNIRRDGRPWRTETLHRFLMAPGPATVDHRNHDGTDNRRQNLRIATHTQQTRNTRRMLGRSLPKGVSDFGPAMDGTPRMVARIRVDGRARHLGVYSSIHSAAIAYDCAAACFFGEFACGNDNELPSGLPAASPLKSKKVAATRAEINAWLAERATVEVAA